MNMQRGIIVFLSAIAFSSLANESGEVQATAADGLDALMYFNSVESFLGNGSGEKSVRRQLSTNCDGTPPRTCIDYLQQNAQTVLAALPNNPEYWRAFHELIDGPAMGFGPTIGDLDKPEYDKSRLITAAYDWTYRAIAEDSIQDTTDQFVVYYRNVRRQMSESSTLIDRMIFTALVGIAHWQIEIRMAIHAAEGDINSIRLLASALTPFSKQERSLRQTFQGEALFVQASIERLEEVSSEDFLNSPYVPAGTSGEMKKWAQEISQIESERATNFIGEVTERSWSDYWGLGFSTLENDLSASENTILTASIGYKSYAITARSSEVIIYPLLALSDAYLGLTSPGLPARAPPAYWNWSWSEETQKICLVPTHIAPNTSDFTIDVPACVAYQAATAT